jgi:hypothetical protein
MATVVALKVAEVAAAGTVTDAGMVSVELVLVRMTVAPPAGAGWVSVTVQVLDEFGPRLVGLQTIKVDAPPMNATAVADQMSGTLRVAVALVVTVVTATRSPDSTQLANALHCVSPLPDISRFVKPGFRELKFSFRKLEPFVNHAKTRSLGAMVVRPPLAGVILFPWAVEEASTAVVTPVYSWIENAYTLLPLPASTVIVSTPEAPAKATKTFASWSLATV